MEFENTNQKSGINYREEVLRLITEKKIKSYSKKVIEDADDEKLERIYNDYQKKQLDETNEKISESLLNQISGLMISLELIENDGSLENDLKDNDLLKRDLKNIVGHVTPYIPYIGLACGAICIGSHIWKKRSKTEEPIEKEN